MKFNKWTIALAAAGVVSLGSVAYAEEQHQVMTALSQTTLSGYVSSSAIWNLGTGASLGPRAYDGAAKQDGFNLDVVKLSLEKPLDEGQWSAGYKVDLLFGPDAATFEAFGGGGGNDIALQNAYVNLRAPLGNGLDIKMGAFENPHGYETFDAGSNPNYSRSYGYLLEPKQFTGVLASYQLVESVGVHAGVANAHTAGLNGRGVRAFTAPTAVAGVAETEKAYLAGLTLTAPESLGFLKGATLYSGIIDGLAGNSQDTTTLYAGLTLPTPVEGLNFGAAWDYQFNSANATTGPDNWAYALAGYATYQATEKLKLGNRLDWLHGSDGTQGLVRGAADPTSQANLLSDTLTIDYSLWANVISRAEVRWDHSLSSSQGFGNAAARNNNFSVAANLIYKF